MPYQNYGETDYQINLEKDTRNRNNPKTNSTKFDLNKDKTPRGYPNLTKRPAIDLRKPTNSIDLRKPSPRMPFNPRRKSTPRNRNRSFEPPEFTEPQPGMVRIPHTPFYHTPNRPIDPRDCARYSNSPYCGGRGFNLIPTDIGFSFVLDDCNFGVELSPTIAYISLPDWQFVWRSDSEDCHPPKPPEPPPFPEAPPLNLPNIDPEEFVYVWLNNECETNYFAEYISEFEGDSYTRTFNCSSSFNWNDFDCPGKDKFISSQRHGTIKIDHLFGGLGTSKYQADDTNDYPYNQFGYTLQKNYNLFPNIDVYNPELESYFIQGQERLEGSRGFCRVSEFLPELITTIDNPHTLHGLAFYMPFENTVEDVTRPLLKYPNIAYYGQWKNIAKEIKLDYSTLQKQITRSITGTRQIGEDYYAYAGTYTILATLKLSIAKVCSAKSCELTPILPFPFPPPPPLPPPPPPPPDDMGCSCADIARIVRATLKSMKQVIEVPVAVCNYDEEEKQWIPTTEYQTIEVFCPNSEQAASLSLLYYNQYKVEFNACTAKNIENIIGYADFPITLPKSLLTLREGFLSDVTPDEIERLFPEESVVIENLPRLIIWFIEQFDALLGEWEVPIQVQDIDATQEGDQGVMMRIPNLAEYAGESIGLLLELTTDMKTLVNMCFRTLMDTGSDKQQNFKSYKMIEALTDYFGFKMSETTVEMPLMFTAGKTKMHEILTESIVNVPIVEFDEKVNFQTTVMKIARIEGILNAQFFRQIDPNGDVKKQIMGYLLRSLTSMEDSKEKNQEKDNDEWEKFKNDVQEGFIRTPGTTERTNPYGKPYANRPKIRDLGDLTS